MYPVQVTSGPPTTLSTRTLTMLGSTASTREPGIRLEAYRLPASHANDASTLKREKLAFATPNKISTHVSVIRSLSRGLLNGTNANASRNLHEHGRVTTSGLRSVQRGSNLGCREPQTAHTAIRAVDSLSYDTLDCVCAGLVRKGLRKNGRRRIHGRLCLSSLLHRIQARVKRAFIDLL